MTEQSQPELQQLWDPFCIAAIGMPQETGNAMEAWAAGANAKNTATRTPKIRFKFIILLLYHIKLDRVVAEGEPLGTDEHFLVSAEL